MGMTSLSRWRVTSKFRLRKHDLTITSCFFSQLLGFNFDNASTQRYSKSYLSWGKQPSIFIHRRSALIPLRRPKKNQCMAATYFNLLVKVKLFQQWLSGFSAHTRTNTPLNQPEAWALMAPWPCARSTSVPRTTHCNKGRNNRKRAHRL